jgi:hypothetical protein
MIWRLLLTILSIELLSKDAPAQDPGDPVELRNARATYQQQIKVATDPIKSRYIQSLEVIKKTLGARGDVQGALSVQNEIDSLGMSKPPPLGSGSRDEARLVIWNQNNHGKGDRGTKKINVSLRLRNKEVWRKNGIRMDWDRTKVEKEVIPVPAVEADTIRVEVVELVNNQGGLGEIEYLKDGTNIALKCSVSVSGVWQNESWCAGKNLTDGTADKYWLLPDKQTGWAEVSLKHRE